MTTHTDNKHKVSSEAHEIFKKYHKHFQGEEESNYFPQFHAVPKTGVIYATSRAREFGFEPTSSQWSNMGQGAPETGTLPNAPHRTLECKISSDEIEYSPIAGDNELRHSVATYYNHLYRQGRESKYSTDNVCIVPGGRAGLTRVMAILGHVQVGYFVPDYTAYEQALNLFSRINPTQYVHRDVNEAVMPPEEFDFQTTGRGISVALLSNPCNPTGQSLEGENLKEYVNIARENNTMLIMDEFYSHYYYDGKNIDPEDGGVDDDTNWPKTVSSSLYINDVNKDPVIIVNGLTKNWRCPGFRVSWIVAPASIVNMISSAGSFLDGGANHPLQRLALPLLDLNFIRQDMWALQRHFKAKRNYLLKELTGLGIKIKWTPQATFYIWGDLSDLPSPLNDSLVFLEECVRSKIICVPGVFFDVNPGNIRNVKKSKCISNVRFSYGPSMDKLMLGMKNMKEVVTHWSTHLNHDHSHIRSVSTTDAPLSSISHNHHRQSSGNF